MIQELLSAVVEERKFSFTGGGLLSDAPSPFLSPTSTATTTISPSSSTTIPSSSTTSEQPQQKLRCPRCDSSNTKFCYYNNYNLTQPRHFCKTCRRYWTKGGALRNVPIGGGCRKAKPASIVAAGVGVGVKSGGGTKPSKPISALDSIARAGFGFDHELFPPSPILWTGPTPTSTHASHLLTLLRSGSLRGLNSVKIKEENVMAEPAAVGLNGPSLDPLGQFSTGMGSLWRNDGQLPYLPLQENNAQFGDMAAAGIQEIYERLRPATMATMTTAYCNEQLSIGNGWPATTAANIGSGGGSSVETGLGGEFGYWNQTLSWSDLSSTN